MTSTEAPPVASSPDRLSLINAHEAAALLKLESSRVSDLVSLLAVLPPAIEGQHTDDAESAEHDFQDTLALEDILFQCGAFRSMFDKRRCSAASYGTILDFNALDVACRLIGRDRFTRSQWRSIVGYWRHNWNLSPILGLLAAQFARFVSLPDPLTRDGATNAFYSGAA